MIHPSLNIDRNELSAVCRRHGIRELYIFGSAIRSDFGPESDVDLLIEFADRQPVWDELANLLDDLRNVFGRDIDLVSGRKSLVNPFRRERILRTLEQLYAA